MLARILPLVLLGALGACSLATSCLKPTGDAGQGGATSGASSDSSGTGMEAGGWWDEAFSRRVRITFKNDGREALTDFPVMVRLDASRIDHGAASMTGADLRFVDADGKTLLPHEIERWSPDGDSIVWVRVPTIDKASSGDHMWLYYGNASAEEKQDAAAVWAGFVGVYHLSLDAAAPQTAASSTGMNAGGWYTGQPKVMVNGVSGDGQIGGGADLDGSRFVSVGDIDDFSVAPDEARTIEAWVKPESLEEQFALHQEGQCRGWYLGIKDNSYVGHLSSARDAGTCGGNYDEYVVTGAASTGAWQHVALVIDRQTPKMRLFINGVRAEEKDIDKTGDTDGNGELRIGASWDGSNSFHGAIDEVRVSRSARSDAWIAAQHLSMTDAFLDFADEPRP